MKQQLKTCLRNHDWYFDHSDDGRVYERGYKEYLNIVHLMRQLDCPFTLLELKGWRFNCVVGTEIDQFVYLKSTEESKQHGLSFPVSEPGYYRRVPISNNWPQVPVNECFIISNELYNKINQWFENH